MRRLSILCLTLFLPMQSIEADVVADQAQVGWYPTHPPLAIGGDSRQQLAQVITAGRDAPLAHLRLLLACSPDSTGNLTVEVQGVNADGVPDGHVLGSATLPTSSLLPTPPSTWSFHDIPISGVGFSSGSRYAIVMRAEPGSQCSTPDGPGTGDPFDYRRGEAWYIALPNDLDTWVPVDDRGKDLVFYTYVEVPGTSTSRARLCEFKDANGEENDWLPDHISICGCLEDRVLRAHRCWFALPEVLLWRELVPQPPGPVAIWHVLPLASEFRGLAIQDSLPDGAALAKPLVFDKGLKPGQPTGQKVQWSVKSLPDTNTVRIRLEGPEGPIDVRFNTELGWPDAGGKPE